MFESYARFKRLENQSWNLNWKKNISEGTKMFREYQLAVWLSIQDFYSHFTEVTRKCECFGCIVEPCLEICPHFISINEIICLKFIYIDITWSLVLYYMSLYIFMSSSTLVEIRLPKKFSVCIFILISSQGLSKVFWKYKNFALFFRESAEIFETIYY